MNPNECVHHIEAIPKECHLVILSFLSEFELARISRVSSYWHHLSSLDRLWKPTFLSLFDNHSRSSTPPTSRNPHLQKVSYSPHRRHFPCKGHRSHRHLHRHHHQQHSNYSSVPKRGSPSDKESRGTESKEARYQFKSNFAARFEEERKKLVFTRVDARRFEVMIQNLMENAANVVNVKDKFNAQVAQVAKVMAAFHEYLSAALVKHQLCARQHRRSINRHKEKFLETGPRRALKYPPDDSHTPITSTLITSRCYPPTSISTKTAAAHRRLSRELQYPPYSSTRSTTGDSLSAYSAELSTFTSNNTAAVLEEAAWISSGCSFLIDACKHLLGYFTPLSPSSPAKNLPAIFHDHPPSTPTTPPRTPMTPTTPPRTPTTPPSTPTTLPRTPTTPPRISRELTGMPTTPPRIPTTHLRTPTSSPRMSTSPARIPETPTKTPTSPPRIIPPRTPMTPTTPSRISMTSPMAVSPPSLPTSPPQRGESEWHKEIVQCLESMIETYAKTQLMLTMPVVLDA